MSKASQALENEVAALIALRARLADHVPSARERAMVDRHIARLLARLLPRIRHFTRAYGLMDAAEDAQQVCAIGLWRAIECYDPDKASFTTLINWQLRGELQGLRHRLRQDQRVSARGVGARTVSADAPDTAHEMATLADPDALPATEAGASQALARQYCGRLLDSYYDRLSARPGESPPALAHRARAERQLLSDHLLEEDAPRDDLPWSAEQRRQILRRTIPSLQVRAMESGANAV
ncbi:RNA polymerase subunit sigma-70 [Novosphingobium sp. FSY-8]|uniref:RNA polymerase subunit sigma-70 n=1 Tax=Novosphingobium ovatum TaxID=1908523 RepID=A0ABW9XHN9_9SPHN|nr:sigma factor [Novosphingobium ovatum]NBC38006.1 RNA polymerase subunit sigma-70 [Novosphingobium ovatum]